MFARKQDAKQAAVWIGAGLVLAALIPAQFNPVLVVKAAIQGQLAKAGK